MKTAIVVTTYNWPAALKWVLFSITQQERLPDEVVVADDGSDPATRICCKQFSDLPLRHAWQPDSGFRAARARNLAMSSINSEHVIMVDGDCLLPPDFVTNHRQLIERGRVVSGGRVLMSAGETTALLRQEPHINRLEFTEGKFTNWPLGLLRDCNPTNWRMVRTCNVGIMMKDVLDVGGFDERFVGWGLEDSDFVVRLLNAGGRIRNGRFAVTVKHLHHAEGKQSISENNRALFEQTCHARSAIKRIRTTLDRDVMSVPAVNSQDD